jgi:hypothetical protein
MTRTRDLARRLDTHVTRSRFQDYRQSKNLRPAPPCRAVLAPTPRKALVTECDGFLAVKQKRPTHVPQSRFAVPVLTQTEDVGDDISPLIGG